MSKLNRDALYLIFGELRFDKNTVYSCLLVNKIWSEVTTPILWKDPWKYLRKGGEESLLNVIVSHLSEESKNNLKNQGIHFLTNLYRRPLFDYIGYCRQLNLNEINRIIHLIYSTHEESKISIFKNEIFNLFINGSTKFTHLYIPRQLDFQIHLVPGAEHCFSELEFLSCSTRINDDVLVGLTELCKSIKELNLFIEDRGNNNYGIVKLIEIPKKLYNIRFQTHHKNIDKSFYAILENSLIKHANTVQYFKTIQPATKILSSLVNLKRLELDDHLYGTSWNCLENVSLPSLQVLITRCVPVKAVASLIENTSGNLTEVNINYIINHDDLHNKKIIQTICHYCPNLKHLKLLFRNSNILELKNLLIKCQYLNGLFIIIVEDVFDFDNFFKMLTKSSPISLFKFKFYFYQPPKLTSLRLFFDNWKGRHPMLLQTNDLDRNDKNEYFDLIEKYKAKGIVEKYDSDCNNRDFEDFEWIQKKI